MSLAAADVESDLQSAATIGLSRIRRRAQDRCRWRQFVKTAQRWTDMGMVHLWVGLGWVGLGPANLTHVHLWDGHARSSPGHARDNKVDVARPPSLLAGALGGLGRLIRTGWVAGRLRVGGSTAEVACVAVKTTVEWVDSRPNTSVHCFPLQSVMHSTRRPAATCPGICPPPRHLPFPTTVSGPQPPG